MIVLLFISFASAITFTSNTMKQDKFERKKGAVLSVNMYNGSDTMINQTFFGVEVDRFSQLQLGGVFQKLNNEQICSSVDACKNIAFSVSIFTTKGDATSVTTSERHKFFEDKDDSFNFVPYFSIIIKCTNGVVDSIEYEKTDKGCPGTLTDGICGVSGSQFDINKTTPSFQIAWDGTDKNKDPLMSIGEILSTYRLYTGLDYLTEAVKTGKSIYEQVQKSVEEAIEKVKEDFDNNNKNNNNNNKGIKKRGNGWREWWRSGERKEKK